MRLSTLFVLLPPGEEDSLSSQTPPNLILGQDRHVSIASILVQYPDEPTLEFYRLNVPGIKFHSNATFTGTAYT